jgi:hypothetical protein
MKRKTSLGASMTSNLLQNNAQKIQMKEEFSSQRKRRDSYDDS